MSAITTNRDELLAATLVELETTEAAEAEPFDLDALTDEHSATSIVPWKITWSTKG